MTDGIDIRHKNLLRRSFHPHMVPQSGMRVYSVNVMTGLINQTIMIVGAQIYCSRYLNLL